MAIRFSPYAIVKVFSYNTLLEARNNQGLSAAIKKLIDTIGRGANVVYSSTTKPENLVGEKIFKTIGLADNVSIDETYNSRPTWGIGEPANPIVVPSNYSASISISRMTLDKLSIGEFTTLPDYWYSASIQRLVETILSEQATARDYLDYPFYTFLFVSSLEEENVVHGSIEAILERKFYVFMPSDYSKRITSGDSIVMTDVRGTGKLLNLRGLIKNISVQ